MLQATAFDVENYLHSKGLQIRRRGSKAEIRLCPFCGGGSHTDLWKCVVYLDQSPGNYKCVRGSCGAAGSFWQLVEHFGDDPRTFYNASRPRRDRNDRATTGLLAPVSRTFPPAPPIEPQQFTAQAIEYLNARGFSEDLLDTLPMWCDEQGCVNFGYYRNGDLCMVKVRQPRIPNQGEQKAWQKWKGGLRTLWCLEMCDPELSQIVITFGEYDCVSLRQAGIANVVSVPCGDQDLDWIDICWDDLQKYEEIILWPDNDPSGHEAVVKIAQRLGPARIKIVKTQYKDANEFLWTRQHEVADAVDEEVRDAVYGAEWYSSGDLMRLADLLEEEQCFDGYTSGIAPLDKAIGGFFFKHLTIHVGDNKHGKSSGVNQITAMAIHEGGKVCVWPGEDAPEDYKYKMYVHLAGFDRLEVKTSQRTGTDYAVVSAETKKEISRFVEDRIFVITSKQATLMTEDVLIQNMTLAFQRYGCTVFVVDNLMKLVVSKHSDNIFSRQTEIVNKLSDFAKQYKVAVHLVCHTNKGQENEPPTKRNASGAKEIINLCDRAIGWWRIPDKLTHKYGNMNSMVLVLADRVFGNEIQVPLKYDKLGRRFVTSQAEWNRDYLSPIQRQFTEIYGGKY